MKSKSETYKWKRKDLKKAYLGTFKLPKRVLKRESNLVSQLGKQSHFYNKTYKEYQRSTLKAYLKKSTNEDDLEKLSTKKDLFKKEDYKW